VNSGRKRVEQAKAHLEVAAREFNAQQQAYDAHLHEPRLSKVIASGLAAGFLAALFPLRAWPRFAANVVRVGVTLARLPVAPALIALASKKYLRRIRSEARIRSE